MHRMGHAIDKRNLSELSRRSVSTEGLDELNEEQKEEQKEESIKSNDERHN